MPPQILQNLFLAGLIANSTRGFASRLTGTLAATTATGLDALLEFTLDHNLNMFRHNLSPLQQIFRHWPHWAH